MLIFLLDLIGTIATYISIILRPLPDFFNAFVVSVGFSTGTHNSVAYLLVPMGYQRYAAVCRPTEKMNERDSSK